METAEDDSEPQSSFIQPDTSNVMMYPGTEYGVVEGGGSLFTVNPSRDVALANELVNLLYPDPTAPESITGRAEYSSQLQTLLDQAYAGDKSSYDLFLAEEEAAPEFESTWINPETPSKVEDFGDALALLGQIAVAYGDDLLTDTGSAASGALRTAGDIVNVVEESANAVVDFATGATAFVAGGLVGTVAVTYDYAVQPLLDGINWLYKEAEQGAAIAWNEFGEHVWNPIQDEMGWDAEIVPIYPDDKTWWDTTSDNIEDTLYDGAGVFFQIGEDYFLASGDHAAAAAGYFGGAITSAIGTAGAVWSMAVPDVSAVFTEYGIDPDSDIGGSLFEVLHAADKAGKDTYNWSIDARAEWMNYIDDTTQPEFEPSVVQTTLDTGITYATDYYVFTPYGLGAKLLLTDGVMASSGTEGLREAAEQDWGKVHYPPGNPYSDTAFAEEHRTQTDAMLDALDGKRAEWGQAEFEYDTLTSSLETGPPYTDGRNQYDTIEEAAAQQARISDRMTGLEEEMRGLARFEDNALELLLKEPLIPLREVLT